ncbi:Ribosomal protein 60S [Mycena venus]|uniref:Ribosomal protein 60S n=1 Tax=Mycena venus TaxID=2733690 RepID=A0A8H7D067_9AGAR|nr:Ribosomal protein 60S [Mycena venus]
MSRPAPLLLDALDSFPAPPTFIPASPAGNNLFNPPPVLSDTDTLLFLASAAPPRSRSKLSLRDNRDSIASTRSSISTRSSPQTPSSAAQSLHRPSLAFSIDENPEEPTDDLLEDAPLVAKAPLDTDDLLEDASVSVPPMPAFARKTPPRTTTPRRESIALTSVAIPAPDSDTEPDFDALDSSPRDDDPRAPPDEEPWEEDFIDDYGQVSNSVRSSTDFTFGYADAAPTPDTQSVDSDDGHRVEPSDADADSDIDLHTSLPELMLHHGFLSARSKLLPHSSAPSPAPSPAASLFSNTDPVPRDTRDTPKRRVRHRDGKLLRGGIGLTTGLGWSDSEDEDAPSALTRRISSLNLHQSASQLGLSRASSLSLSARASTFSSSSRARASTLASSTRTSTFSSSSASRSTSRAGASRRTQSEHEHEATDTDMSVDEFGTYHQPIPSASRGKAPPTSWARRSDPTSRLSRAQSHAALGRMASIRTEDSSHSVRTTTSAETARSASSTSSLPLMRTRSRVLRDDAKPLPRTPSLKRNPSTANTTAPGTPRSLIRPRATTGIGAPSGLPQPHSRVPLSMQSTPQPGLPSTSSTDVAPPLPAPGPAPALRPLRLQPRQPVLGGDRAPVPVPAVLHGMSPSGTASSLSSSVSSAPGLSASTSASSVDSVPSPSLLTPSSSAQFATGALSPYGVRGPPSPGYGFPMPPASPGFMGPPSPMPSPGFAAGGGFAAQQAQSLKTPTTPMYEQGTLPRPRPRTGTGMVYRTSSYATPPAVRASKIGIAL